jgi:hypothetical protein
MCYFLKMHCETATYVGRVRLRWNLCLSSAVRTYRNIISIEEEVARFEKFNLRSLVVDEECARQNARFLSCSQSVPKNEFLASHQGHEA